jgi:hypothetical protein
MDEDQRSETEFNRAPAPVCQRRKAEVLPADSSSSRVPLRNDLGTLIDGRARFPFVAIGALSTRLPLAADTRSGPGERSSGSSNARPVRVSLLSGLRAGSEHAYARAWIWRSSRPPGRAPWFRRHGATSERSRRRQRDRVTRRPGRTKASVRTAAAGRSRLGDCTTHSRRRHRPPALLPSGSGPLADPLARGETASAAPDESFIALAAGPSPMQLSVPEPRHCRFASTAAVCARSIATPALTSRTACCQGVDGIEVSRRLLIGGRGRLMTTARCSCPWRGLWRDHPVLRGLHREPPSQDRTARCRAAHRHRSEVGRGSRG